MVQSEWLKGLKAQVAQMSGRLVSGHLKSHQLTQFRFSKLQSRDLPLSRMPSELECQPRKLTKVKWCGGWLGGLMFMTVYLWSHLPGRVKELFFGESTLLGRND